MGSRKVGASRRAQTNWLDGRIGAGDHPRPATAQAHDATRREPPRPLLWWLWAGLLPPRFSDDHRRPSTQRRCAPARPGQGPNLTALAAQMDQAHVDVWPSGVM
ncbi:hypothetical protein PVAP13_1KG111073 [Panicum virgatum]|uniref:Uncharacterized protein n=1 Tax=Panicum virgatum TaxID=38727 RepID=A0A8T0XU91_PANVG|nr:hypothetical protein PVAP13_1KG111073 [Panicum virgatum]